MKKLPLLIGALAALAIPALRRRGPDRRPPGADGQQRRRRRRLRRDHEGRARLRPVVGKAAILAFSATAQAYGDFFPEGSVDPARSAASPKIWEDMAGFQAELAKFQAAAAAGVEAAGKDGPADKAAFAAAVQPILAVCKSCHEGYRIEN